MRRLSYYLFRQLTAAFLFGTAAITFVVLFTQLFRLLSLVIDNSATMMVFFHMIALSIPTFLPLVLPLGLGIATLFVYHKLAVDSELIVMNAAGIGPAGLARPAVLLGAIVMVFCLGLTLWIAPKANSRLVNLQYRVRDSYAVFLSHPGSFNDITDGVTFYARRRGSNGSLEGILIHDVRHAEDPVTIMADTGQVSEANGVPQIVVFNGRRQEMNLATGKLSELSFEQYVIDLDALRSAASRRSPDPREMTALELFSQTDAPRQSPEQLLRMSAELNQRFAVPLLVMSFVMIGLAAILAGEFNRRGMGRRILIAAITIIIVQATFMSLNSVVARHPWFAVSLYVTALTPVLVCATLLRADGSGSARLRPPSGEVAT